jgi:hypothetical protein
MNGSHIQHCKILFANSDEAWEQMQTCLDPSHRRSFLQLISSADNLAQMIQHSRSQSDPSIALYTLQLVNLLYATEPEFRAMFNLRWIKDDDFELLVDRALTHQQILKPMKIGFVLVFNVIKEHLHSLKITPADIHDPAIEEQSFKDMSSLQVLKMLIEGYFSRVSEISHDTDTVIEWIVYLFDLLVNNWTKHSTVEFFIRGLSESSLEHFFNFLHITIDETIKSKTVHSLIVDLKADLLDKDEDFSQRLMPSDGKFLLFLRKADVVFLVRFFAELASPNSVSEFTYQRLSTINDILRTLVCISFVGAYNSPLQKLIIDRGSDQDNFGFLGKLSDLLTTLTKSKVKDNKIPTVPELNTNIIRMACNMVHANLPAQDFILDHGFLPFYLSHTNRDEHNMHAKEVTVVFVRYMTEGNLRAREMIKALKVEDFILENASFVKKFDSL